MVTSAFIDWMSVTHKHSGNKLLNILPECTTKCTARNGYTLAYQSIAGVIMMQNPDRPDMGTHIVYSGKTLATCQDDFNVSRDNILRHHTTIGGRVSRIDFAVDIVDENLSLERLWDQLENKTAITRSSHSRTQSGNNRGDTVYVGSRKTRRKMIRAYDKAKEQHDFVSDYKRIELECRSDAARNSAELYQNSNYDAAAIVGMIRQVCDFPNDDNWSRLFESPLLKIPVAPPTSGETEKWLLKQCAPAMARTLLLDEQFYIRWLNAVQYHTRKMRGE